MEVRMPTCPTGADVGTPGPQPSRLRLSDRERAGLIWLRERARHWLTAAKRARKYRPHQQVIDDDECEQLTALVQLEKAAATILAGINGDENGSV